MWKTISKLIFWFSITFIIISLCTLTFAQKTNLEFQNHITSNNFYNTILMGLPLAIILTLFGTIKKKNEIIRNVFTSISTIVLGVFVFIFIVNNLFILAYGSWVTIDILYKNKTDNQKEIREQQYDLGAFGYGKKRTVEVKPFTFLFYEVTEIDISKIDKAEWKLVNAEGDIKYP